MYQVRPRMSLSLVHERKRGYIITGVVVALVLVISVVAIWKLHSSAISKIDQAASVSAEEYSGELGEAARVDPVGFNLANYMHAHYGTIVIVVYYLLGALAIAAVARFAVFLISSSDRSRFYPNDASLEEFLLKRFENWKDFAEAVMAKNHLRSRFWRILKDSVMVTESSGRYDHLYLHLRNRIDTITDHLNEATLYESIATVSPAAGFFGTLVGLLYIFSSSNSGMAGLSESPAFAVGMKVAIITSLWGLFNLGMSVIFAFITKRIIGRIHEQMVVRGVIVCEIAESVSTPQHLPENEHQTEYEAELHHIPEPEDNVSKESLRV
jgi:biopolymer transport protein ExbB/TolQ